MWIPTQKSKLFDQDFLSFFRNTGFNELQNLKYLPRSMIEREIVFEDRTPAHADHVGFGFERKTTAAVGEYKHVQESQVQYTKTIYTVKPVCNNQTKKISI